MKAIVLIALLVSSNVTAQTITNWDRKTDSLIQVLPDGPNRFRFNEIIDRRKTYGFDKLLDTTLHIVRIQEMYDVKTNEFDMVFDFFGIDYKETLDKEWDYMPIDSIRPRNYELYLGCIVRDKEPKKVRKWKRRIGRMETVKETFYIIDTVIDKSTQTINISLRVPVYGKRVLESFYGPLGKSKRPQLKKWYY